MEHIYYLTYQQVGVFSSNGNVELSKQEQNLERYPTEWGKGRTGKEAKNMYSLCFVTQ